MGDVGITNAYRVEIIIRNFLIHIPERISIVIVNKKGDKGNPCLRLLDDWKY